MHFGLIGRSLSHSFSKDYFEQKFRKLNLSGNTYSNFDLDSVSEFPSVIEQHPDLKGLNVTAPYKEQIIPFLDSLSDEAKIIGAVNCIKFNNGKKEGYNTDVYGFKQSIKPFLEPAHNRALIFGTGGSSKAVAYALKQIGVEYYFVTSASQKKQNNTFFYSELNEIIFKQFLLLVNCTPLGMHPIIDECVPIPYQLVGPQHLAYDLIYNPEETLFLKQCKEKNAVTINGYSMLQLQAEKSWEIWNS
jgi:shikimate dehydrogenase